MSAIEDHTCRVCSAHVQKDAENSASVTDLFRGVAEMVCQKEPGRVTSRR
jgi:hypothetical protein